MMGMGDWRDCVADEVVKQTFVSYWDDIIATVDDPSFPSSNLQRCLH